MRIVLAQRSGDPTQLERARPVLERLGDRQFLRRLHDTAAALQWPAPDAASYRRRRGKPKEPAKQPKKRAPQM
jgi:hypothetical protein